jgi:hypothetical protein
MVPATASAVTAMAEAEFVNETSTPKSFSGTHASISNCRIA